ncbi:transposase [Halalkalibacter sp. AB-rgal2]|uniref:transposase n=1 Tax=Halalkalibacter sp. AB-rgal2 TaxID=3242695 RepID=UPI00359D4C91
MPKKRFTAEEKVEIVIRGLGRETSIKELCNEVGIQPKSYYDWKQTFMKYGMEGFKTSKSTNDSEKESLKKENNRLKEVVANLSLENHILKKRHLKPYLEAGSYNKLPADEKLEIIKFIDVIPKKSVTWALKQMNLSRSTYYDWKKRYEEDGYVGLIDQPPIPNSHPDQLLQEEIEKIIEVGRKTDLEGYRAGTYELEKDGVYISESSASS